MSCCDTGAGSVCPCGLLVTPLLISNGPELDTIAYRVGDYTSFRHALLLPRSTETAALELG